MDLDWEANSCSCALGQDIRHRRKTWKPVRKLSARHLSRESLIVLRRDCLFFIVEANADTQRLNSCRMEAG